MDGFFQARGRWANGVIIDGPNVDVFVGYGRDHDRRVGAGTFTTRLGSGKIVFHRVPDLISPMQQRFRPQLALRLTVGDTDRRG